MAIEFYFTPELHLKDGRIIRDLDDATSFAREQETRPGVDQRDEVLHKMEHAERRLMLRRIPLCDGSRNWRFSNSSTSHEVNDKDPRSVGPPVDDHGASASSRREEL
jgi:hypothetical protein